MSIAAWAAVILAGVGMLTSVLSSSNALRFAAALVSGGLLVVRLVVLIGIVRRRRWGPPLGVVLSLAGLALPVVAQLRVEVGEQAVTTTPISALLAWAQALVGVAFLAGAWRATRPSD